MRLNSTEIVFEKVFFGGVSAGEGVALTGYFEDCVGCDVFEEAFCVALVETLIVFADGLFGGHFSEFRSCRSKGRSIGGR